MQSNLSRMYEALGSSHAGQLSAKSLLTIQHSKHQPGRLHLILYPKNKKETFCLILSDSPFLANSTEQEWTASADSLRMKKNYMILCIHVAWNLCL